MADTDHDLTIQIKKTVPGRSAPANCPGAYLVQIYPPGPTLGSRHVLEGAAYVLGRDSECDIIIDDPSVSRRHARFEPDGDAYRVIDLQSTNGTAVNKVKVAQCLLQDGDALRFGSCIFRFLSSGNVEAQYHEEIYRLTVHDSLTHIPNRRFLFQFLERELARSARYQRPLALVLFDIDHFKAVNDEHGHLAGDFALRELAQCVQGVVRKEGLFARYGGEEFAVVLPEATLEIGTYVAERIRLRVEQHPFVYEGKAFALTVSLGVTATPGGQPLTPLQFIQQADDSLFQAKRDGRNRVVVERHSVAPPVNS